MKNWFSLCCCKFSKDYFVKKCFAKKSIFTNLWRHEGVNFADFTKKFVFLLFLTHSNQIYEKLTQPILLQIFWRLFWKKKLRKKKRFASIYDTMKVCNLLILPKNAFFALFDTFNPNIWKINSAYLVANFLKII